MELEPPQPPAYSSHNPRQLDFPSVPQSELESPVAQGDLRLPDLKTVLSADFHYSSPSSTNRPDGALPEEVATPPGSLPRIDPGPIYQRGTRSSMDSNVASPSESGSAMSVDEHGSRSIKSVSMDDPDVRIAAEALSGLGRHVPGSRPTAVNGSDRFQSHAPLSHHLHPYHTSQQTEPLLQLFTKAHPWMGSTINGSLNAYSTTKYYSPRFVQYGANLVERNIAEPIVDTVSSVGRMTGVESGLRWYLDGNSSNRARRPSDLERGDEHEDNKRRRIADPTVSYDPAFVRPGEDARLRRESSASRSEWLPAYGASKPPSYREEVSPAATDRELQSSQNQSWSSQIFVMTSGLGVALSDTSRRSLKYCLNMLGQSAVHVHTVTEALKLVLEQYDQARDVWHQNHDAEMETGEKRPRTPDHDEAARRLAELIKKHSDDIWSTLRHVVNSVSERAGGALPENARQFVRQQLMSLPQRWQFVSGDKQGENTGSETSRGAHRMVAFATEGLDMISQVSQTMSLTLESAEGWLARYGRRQQHEESPYAKMQVEREGQRPMSHASADTPMRQTSMSADEKR